MKGQKGYVWVAKAPSHNFLLTDVFAAVWKQLLRWHELHAQRQQLRQISDAALKDLGLSRADIIEESERRFWDDPLRK
ncbi:hypothetical protein D3C76_1433410 [compost metagenome]